MHSTYQGTSMVHETQEGTFGLFFETVHFPNELVVNVWGKIQAQFKVHNSSLVQQILKIFHVNHLSLV